MRDFIEKNKILCLAVVILALGFYWYSYRPYAVAKTCIQVALDRANEVQGDQTDARYFFWKCQRQHGIGE